MHLVQFINKDVRSRERVARSLFLEWMFIIALPEFEFGDDVYQGSVLNFALSLCKSNSNEQELERLKAKPRS